MIKQTTYKRRQNVLNLQLHKRAEFAFKANLFIKNKLMLPLVATGCRITFSLFSKTILIVNLQIINGNS